LRAFRKGIEHIVARTPVPVVPMGLSGLWGSLFSRARKRLRDLTLGKLGHLRGRTDSSWPRVGGSCPRAGRRASRCFSLKIGRATRERGFGSSPKARRRSYARSPPPPFVE
jgi:hypothetical protein